LYESTDAGATFTAKLILPQDTASPGSPTGGDFFRGGVPNIQLYRASGETQVYASAFDYGIYRRSTTQDGDTDFHQIFVSAGGGRKYGELPGGGLPRRSTGRAVQRSENAGVDFTDMTIDTQGVSLHPDQHAIAATPFNPNIVFIANDGGLWRLNGSFSNVSSQ